MLIAGIIFPLAPASSDGILPRNRAFYLQMLRLGFEMDVLRIRITSLRL